MKYITDERQAELNAAELMKRWGYLDAHATPVGADGGIDVISRDALAQVKWRGGAAGRPEIQALYGARGHGDQALFFFAASRFTPDAIKYARAEGINLYVYDPAGRAQPVYVVDRLSKAHRSWASPDFIALYSVCRRALRLLGGETAHRASKHHGRVRRA